MAYLYDYRQFNQLDRCPDDEALDTARKEAKQRGHTIVVECGNDFYRVTPKGRNLPMPSWFMPATLGGKP